MQFLNLQILFDNNYLEEIIDKATDYVWLEKPFSAMTP